MTKAAGDWCWRCRHCIVRVPRAGWVHLSDDDWSEFSCTCANQLLPCEPWGYPWLPRVRLGP